jgi:glucose/arabinose dehydrogenase
MKTVKILSLLAAVLLANSVGCRKRPPAAPPAPEAANPTAPAQKLATGHVVPATLKEFESSVVLADLNKNLQIFLAQKQRLPTDLDELARIRGMPIPTPPAGTKLVIDAKAKAVKVVPQ